jgi:hypothetical protein
VGYWEVMSGELLLPAAAVAEVKKALRDANNAHVDAVYRHAKAFWKAHATQSRTKYAAAAETYVEVLTPRTNHYDATAHSAADQLAGDLSSVLAMVERDTRGRSLRGATWDDMARCGLTKASNRDVQFGSDDGSVIFDGRTIRWRTDQYKRSVERFENSGVGVALFAALGKVAWTRGTGGVAYAQDEYGVDVAVEHGGNAVSIYRAYGPRGAETYRRRYGSYPHGSPEALAEQAKKQRRADAAKRAAATRSAASQATAANSFCGHLNAERSQLCGQLLTAGGCPTHGASPDRVSIGG